MTDDDLIVYDKKMSQISNFVKNNQESEIDKKFAKLGFIRVRNGKIKDIRYIKDTINNRIHINIKWDSIEYSCHICQIKKILAK